MSQPVMSPEERKGPIAWMAGHSVAANLVMVAFLAGGLLALTQIKQEVFPDLELDIVTVSVSYPGASPEEVERGIIQSVEEAVRGLDGVDEVTSVASEGSGTVTIELLLGADVQKLADEVRSEVDRITTFPEDAEEPEVRIVSHQRGVLDLAIYGKASDQALLQLGEQVRDVLLQDPDITQVDVTGLPPLEIRIEVPQENLRRYGLTLQEIADKLAGDAVEVPGGGLKTDTGEVLLRVKERREWGREFARLPVVTAANGSEVPLEKTATIDDSFADTDRYTLFNGEKAVIIEVYRVGNQTPIQVSDAVRRHLDEIRADLPPNIKLDITRDRSDYYRQRLTLLIKNGLIGLSLVIVMLGIFLEARLAFWVMMGVPISFLGSFLFLPSADVTINMMSLFAYIITAGIVVDDAIVVGENVYHHHQEGMSFRAAAVRGAREVAMPVTFSILTNIATFVPIYFIPGVMGKIFKMIPVVVVIVFLISLGECLFVLPAHLAHQRDRRRRGLTAWLHDRQQAFSHAFRNWVRTRYGRFLHFVLRHRYVTVTLATGILVLTMTYVLSGRMRMVQFPQVESDRSEATVVLPYGSPVAKTERIVKRLLAGARQVVTESGHPELVQDITADVGRSGSHTGRVRVELADAEIRDKIMSTAAFTDRWREVTGEVTGVEYLKFSAESGGPGSRGRPIAVQLSHRRMTTLEEASKELAEILATYPGVKDVDDGFQPGKQQLDYTLKPEGKSLGLSARDLSREVRNAFYGAEAVRQQRGRNEVKVMVRLPESERATEQTLDDFLIRTPAGTYVPLNEIAERTRGRAYTTIDRRAGQRVVTVSSDITPRSKAAEVLEDLRERALPELIARHPGLNYSFEGHQADIRESLGSLMVSFPLAVLAIYAMLAIPFRSYAQPLIVMTSIPFGIVGAVIGHLIMGYNLCIPSMFGIVALSGVVVNDSLVLIDFANRRERETGLSRYDAVHDAAIQRFRPILLTTLTTFGGLAPMIFETSRQARFMIPMAVSLGYGLLFATLITLVLVPSLYLVTDDVTSLRRRLRAAAEPFEPVEPETS